MSKINLSDPTPRDEIKSRQGPGGRMLDYIDARFVMDRLDTAVGSESWQDKYEDAGNGSVRCGIGIRYGEEWIWKWDVGDPSDIEAVKGAHSDAFKRAGVKWGIGRDLYGDHPAPAKAAPRPAERPRTAAAPSAEPEMPPFPTDDLTPAAQEAFHGLIDESKCPAHDKAWRSNSRGFYCSTKVGDGWCREQPSKAWIASQELVPA